MRYVGLLLEHLGEQANNRRSDVTSTSGVSDNEILQYLTQAQRYIQSQVLRQVGHTNFFDTTTTASVVGGQKNYTLPSDCYFGHKVRRVRYTSTNQAADYCDIYPVGSTRFTEDFTATSPTGYAVGNGTLVLTAVPTSSQGTLQITYPRRLDRLDIRRGKIAAVVTDAGNYSTIELEDDDDLDSTEITKYIGDYLCVNSILGVVNYYNAQIADYDAGTRIVTLTGADTDDGTIAAGGYITLGRYSTTHSKLPDECEDYLINFADWKLKKGDSSEDASEANAEMVMLMDDIIAQFANMVSLETVMVFDPFGEFSV